MQRITAGLGVALVAVLACQSPQENVARGDTQKVLGEAEGRQVAQRVFDEVLTRGEAYSKLEELCRVAPHRLSGSNGAQTAVEWAKAKMIEDGLENVRLESCMVPHWERGRVESLIVTAPPELAGTRLPILALGGSVNTPEEGIEAAVLVVKSFEELEALGDDARDKIVLFNRPMDDTSLTTFAAYGGAVGERTQGAVQAAKAGALASIARSMTTLRNDVPHTGAMGYREDTAKVPGVSISTNGADRIEEWLASGLELRVRLELSCRTLPDSPSWNVVGELVGSEWPEEIVLLGGHLDAWDVGQGAHDDGAGCVQAMEALRLLKVLGLRPKRTLRCVLFMNEENGLAGGRAYYAAHKGEMKRHVMALESDSGGFTPRGFTTDAGPEAMATLATVASWLAGSGAERVAQGHVGADISPMQAGGVPLVGYEPDSQRYFDFHHSTLDVFEAVNERELQLGAGSIAVLVWGVAEWPTRLTRN